ncbi:hypothetical protein HXA31_06775 [Salipaludibacillus agaradhaerens]|uniref:Uncharacterized protein n=1 Tax=Salipaludibacillus agaradhaerens TaxID=76935 RepID=A0A9Q4FYI0_SALAG|nr:hypothetical protein [Salipaludibacillus agaradhaerens]MCR6096376.1 hypothetical protein [Salipaludibacillus agaradhaerens]MCR6114065.1 hypothetical protein [Salipaludibacillus agaradhaerens]
MEEKVSKKQTQQKGEKLTEKQPLQEEKEQPILRRDPWSDFLFGARVPLPEDKPQEEVQPTKLESEQPKSEDDKSSSEKKTDDSPTPPRFSWI